MFVPETYGLALLLIILCMICWGSVCASAIAVIANAL